MKRKYEDLTPENIRMFPGLENLNDEQAAVLAEKINTFAALLVRVDLENITPYNEEPFKTKKRK